MSVLAELVLSPCTVVDFRRELRIYLLVISVQISFLFVQFITLNYRPIEKLVQLWFSWYSCVSYWYSCGLVGTVVSHVGTVESHIGTVVV